LIRIKGLGVTLEQASHSAESVTSSMTCPKCGHEQEERLDCLKCGVVFSKYYALFRSSKSPSEKGFEDPIAQEQSEQERRVAISDLQLQLREISVRIAEVEFEKAERNQLRTELKNLEQHFQANLEQIALQLEQIEKRLAEPSVSTFQQEMEDYFPRLLKRLEQVESKLEGLEDIGSQINDLNEKNGAGSKQLSMLQSQHSALREEFAAIKSQLEQVCEAQRKKEPSTPLEIDVHAIRKHLDEFREMLGKGTES
jgi:DNA repair exonuclease SbcCD ATPase subunit